MIKVDKNKSEIISNGNPIALMKETCCLMYSVFDFLQLNFPGLIDLKGFKKTIFNSLNEDNFEILEVVNVRKDIKEK